VKGTSKNQKKIDNLISLNLKNWKLSRIESLVRSILRISIYELLYETNVPKKVIFNEYIEIAKFFFDGEESSLINAVLDAVSKNDDK
jgi:N utilization substance protein B